jgi:hypothetical protein
LARPPAGARFVACVGVVLQVLTIILLNRRQRVVLWAPTHQAVGVLGRKLKGHRLIKAHNDAQQGQGVLKLVAPPPRGQRLKVIPRDVELPA